jgi:hypothetical protein
MSELIDRGRLASTLESAVRRVLVAEGLLGRLSDRPVRPQAIEDERIVLDAVLGGDAELSELAELRGEDLADPAHRWVLGQLRAGAKSVSELVAAAERHGFRDGLRPELEAFTRAPRSLPLAPHLARIIEMSRRRKIIERTKSIVAWVELGEMSADEALDALGKMASGPRRAK